MQRPVMNPLFADGDPAAPRPSPLRRLGAMLCRVPAVLLADVRFWRKGASLRIDVGSRAARILQGLLYRAVFVPVLLVLTIASLVYLGTHPRRTLSSRDPQSDGIYYDPVSIASGDGVQLEGWLVPRLDPQRVIDEGEHVLRARHPAVVLVHDYGDSRQQMLPLVRPLHDAGFIVLAINLRGSGTSGSGAATFGLNESFDIQAAVEMLRRRSFVDPDRIAIVGVGTGASAAILAANRDPMIRALALEHPVTSIDAALQTYVAPRQAWLSWTGPVCRWAFELTYRVDSSELEQSLEAARTARRAMLVYDDSSAVRSLFSSRGTRQLTEFLQAHTAPPAPQTAAAQ